MDIPQVLAVLAPGISWGRSAQTGATYQEFEEGWLALYGPEDPPPTEAEMLATWTDLEANRATREAQTRRSEAIALLMASNEPRDVALRALIRDLYTQLNDIRELLARPRTLEPEIVTRVVMGIGDGLGEV